jgi:hypothetical protein
VLALIKAGADYHSTDVSDLLGLCGGDDRLQRKRLGFFMWHLMQWGSKPGHGLFVAENARISERGTWEIGGVELRGYIPD